MTLVTENAHPAAAHAQLRALLSEVPVGASLAAYVRAARELLALEQGLLPVRASLLASYTLEPLAPFFTVEVARAGFQANLYHAPFNSIQQELLDPAAGCVRHSPDVVFVAPLLSDVSPALAFGFPALQRQEAEQEIESLVAEFAAGFKAFRQHSSAPLVVHNFVLPPCPALGLLEPGFADSQSACLRLLNERWARALTEIPGVYVLDCERACAEVGYQRALNERTWYSGHAPWSPEMLARLGALQAGFVASLAGRAKKCLVVDLDNTLWGGVLGEDGIHGIALGHDWPGNAFVDVQRYLLQLHQRGVLLAINSKNNAAEVAEVFQSHPHMVLRPEHFAAQRVNWKPKPENMLELADELNLGLDSLAFFDDNPVELELMRQSLPQVLVLPSGDERGNADPLAALKTLRGTRAFDRLSFTDDDRRRGAMYRQQAARRETSQAATSVDEFLRSLELTAEVTPVGPESLARVVDLIGKTNQFNLTTRRHSAAAVQEMIADAGCGVFQLRVGDRFGDNGIVGVALIALRDDLAEIDTFLLSCRVIGRTVETALLAHLIEWARQRGAAWMQGSFFPTAKNAPAADFFSRHGFSQIGGTAVGGSQWQLDLAATSVIWPDYISRGSGSEHKVEPGATSEPGSESDPIASVVSRLLDVPLAELREDSSPETLPQWDSLNHLNLVMALESELHTSFSPEQALAMRSLAEIRRIVAGEAAPAAHAIEFRDARQADLPAFREFIFSAYGPGYVLGANPAYLEWQFRRTAISQGNDFHIRLAWLENRIAGCLGYVPCEIDAAGRTYRGCWLANWMVGPDFRHLGLGPALVRDVSAGFETTLALGANQEARDVFSRMGWTDFGTLRRHVAVLDLDGAQPLAEQAPLAWESAALAATAAARSDSRVKRVDRFAEDVAELWHTLWGSSLACAGTRRTAGFLNWRYAEHSVFEYRLFELRAGKRLCGVAVYRLEQARNLPVKIARLLELFGDEGATSSLLATLLCHARESGAAVADHFGGSELQAAGLGELGFLEGSHSLAQNIPTRYQPVDRKKSTIRFLADLRQIPHVGTNSSWYVSKADGDQDRPN